MPSINEWFNVYAGIRENVGALKAALQGTQSALADIRDDLEIVKQDLKGTGNLNDLSLSNQITKIAHVLQVQIYPALSNLQDALTPIEGSFALPVLKKLDALTEAIAAPALDQAAQSDAIVRLVTELTKPGSSPIIENWRKFFQTLVDNTQVMTEIMDNAKGTTAEAVIGGIVKKGQSAIETALVEALETVRPVLDILSVPFNAVLNTALDEFTKEFEANAPADPNKARQLVTSAVQKAYRFGEAAHYIAVAAEMFQPLKQLGFPQLAAALGDLSGFKEISGTLSRTLIGASIMRPMRWWGNDVFSPEILTTRDLIELVEKREINLTHFARVLFQHGYNHEDVDLLTKAVWREPSIRDLALAIEDATVDEAWLFRRVQRAGYEDADAERLTTALGQRAIKTTRGALIAAARATVTDGILDLDSYRTILEGLDLRPDVIALEIRTAELTARRDYVNAAVGTYKRAYLKDQISREDCALALTTLGVVQDRVDLILADADTERLPRIAREEEAREKAVIREIQRELVPRYRRLYELGVIDDQGYQNALIEAGITPNVAATVVILDRQKRAIVTQKATSAALEREIATLVSETETALRLQYRKGLIDEGQLRGSLLDLGYTEDLAETIVNQERARLAPPPGRAIETPDEAKARVLRDLGRQAALNDFRRGRIEALDLFDELVRLGFDEDEALALVNVEIARLPAAPTPR